MLYSAFISQLRSQVGDTKRPKHVDWSGDGATTVFALPSDSFPVYDDSTTYAVKVGGVLKTEITDYTLDKAAGTIIFVSAPASGSNNVTLDSYAVHLQDADYLNIINAVIRSLGDDFWKEFVDEVNFIAMANMLSIDLSSQQPNCIAIYEFSRRLNAAEDWRRVADEVNWRFDRDNNKIYIGRRDAFTISGELLRIRGLKTYTIGTLVGDTIDVQDKFLTVVEYGCISRYWKWRYKDVVELVSKMTQESTRTPLQELIMLSDRFDRLFEAEKARLKPQKPPMIKPIFLDNGGTP